MGLGRHRPLGRGFVEPENPLYRGVVPGFWLKSVQISSFWDVGKMSPKERLGRLELKCEVLFISQEIKMGAATAHLVIFLGSFSKTNCKK